MYSHSDTTPPSPPSSPEVPSPIPAALGLAREVVVAGFRDCSREALAYLVEVEGLALEHPLVAGLQRHLAEKEAELWRTQCCLPAAYHYNYYTHHHHGYHPHTLGYLHGNQTHVAIPPQYPVTYHMKSPQPAVPASLPSPAPSLDSSISSTASTDSSMCDLEVEDILHPRDSSSSSSSSSCSWEEVRQSAQRLDALAQNNEKIGSLLTELFGLMDEEDEEDEEESECLSLDNNQNTLVPLVPML